MRQTLKAIYALFIATCINASGLYGQGTAGADDELDPRDLAALLAEVRDDLLTTPGLQLCNEVVHRDAAILDDVARAGLPSFVHSSYGIYQTVLNLKRRSFYRPDDAYVLRRLPKKHAKAIAAYPQLDTLVACARTHFDLIELVHENAFTSDYPFRIRSDSASLIREIQSYRLRHSDRVLDVGAGSGFLGLVLARAGFSVVAEDLYGDFIQSRVADLPPETQALLRVVVGDKKSTTLEDETFDVIIVRNAFHHFKRHEAMLASLRASMRPGSRLLIVDGYTDLEPDESIVPCNARLSVGKAKARLAEAGFELTREERAGVWWLMEYVLPREG